MNIIQSITFTVTTSSLIISSLRLLLCTYICGVYLKLYKATPKTMQTNVMLEFAHALHYHGQINLLETLRYAKLRWHFNYKWQYLKIIK
mgnify:FL=1